jgi:regulator of protease activity HflC (stomatin/prohibitin superfamily)
MKSLRILAILAISAVAVALVGCGQVPAGYEGIKFNKFGGNKGVSENSLGPGTYPLGFNEELYTYPVFIQQYPFNGSEEIVFQTKDGMKVSCDVAIAARVYPGKTPLVFQQFRKDFDQILHTFFHQEIRNLFNAYASTMGVESIYGEGKTALLANVNKDIRAYGDKFGIEVEQVSYLSDIRVPANVQTAINAKIQATQQAQQRENEVATAKAEAQKKVETAKGEAQSIEIQGTALRANPEVLELRKLQVFADAVDKWNGKLPETLLGSNAASLLVTPPVK